MYGIPPDRNMMHPSLFPWRILYRNRRQIAKIMHEQFVLFLPQISNPHEYLVMTTAENEMLTKEPEFQMKHHLLITVFHLEFGFFCQQ